MGKRVNQFSFKTILFQIHVDNNTSFSKKKKINIIKLFSSPDDNIENRAVAKIFLKIFDENTFSLSPSCLDGISPRDLGNLFNRIIYRGDIKCDDLLKAIATQIQRNPSEALRAIKNNVISLFKEYNVEKITAEHSVFNFISAENFGNKSAENLVEMIKQFNNDSYLALSILLLISLYPVPPLGSKKTDVLEEVIRIYVQNRLSNQASPLFIKIETLLDVKTSCRKSRYSFLIVISCLFRESEA